MLTGHTDIGANLADADLFLVDDGAGGTLRKVAASRIKTYASGAALDDITTGDAASTLATSAGNITIDAQGSDTDIIFKGTDGSTDITALSLDMSDAGKATFNGLVDINADATGLGDAKLTLLATGSFPSTGDTLTLSQVFGSTSSVTDGVGDSSYIFYFQDVYGASANKMEVQLELNESFATGNDYSHVCHGYDDNGNNSLDNHNSGRDRFAMHAVTSYAANWASRSGFMIFPRPRNTSARKTAYGQISYFDANGYLTTEDFAGRHSDGSNKCTGFRIVASAGAWTAGTYRLYGYRS